MFQYGGGVGAWITGAATYGIDLDKMTAQVWDTLPPWARDEAESFLQYLYADALERLRKALADGKDPDAARALCEARKLKARHLLPERTFIACDAIKRLWRKAHPAISSYWKEIENAVEYCILNPGEVQTCRKLKIKRSGVWLRIGLPSGRELCYPGIGLNVKVTLPDGKRKTISGISYMGVSQYTKKWERISTYGGKFFEQFCQAAACDQLKEPQQAIEDAGFEIVLDIHDEDICEAPIDRDDLNPEHLGALMCSSLQWNEGLPLAAAGYETTVAYRKE
jgi:DNA polymerase